MQVEIWSDVVCPWCYIGKKRFETALENLAAEGIAIDIDIVFRPFQLDPRAPINSTSPVIEGYAKKFGGIEQAEKIIGHVTAAAADSGITFNMGEALRANTLGAHRLLYLALQHHGSDVQNRVKQALLESYFTNGRDIGTHEVLIEAATSAGIPLATAEAYVNSHDGDAEVRHDIMRAGDLGITAVPTFVFDGKWSVPGAQDVAVFENVLRRLSSRALSD